jgi:hypothetical protein
LDAPNVIDDVIADDGDAGIGDDDATPPLPALILVLMAVSTNTGPMLTNEGKGDDGAKLRARAIDGPPGIGVTIALL